MKRLIQLASILLVAVAVLGVVCWISVAHAQTITWNRVIPHRGMAPRHKMAPHEVCPGKIEVIMARGHECLSKGNTASFYHVIEIHNDTDVTIRFNDHTLNKTFEIAPGECKMFEDDESTISAPMK